MTDQRLPRWKEPAPRDTRRSRGAGRGSLVYAHHATVVEPNSPRDAAGPVEAYFAQPRNAGRFVQSGTRVVCSLRCISTTAVC